MGFTRISNAEINSRGATRLPNQPQISAAALKEEFDAPAKQIVAPKVNNLMDELEASTSAGNLGAVAPAGRTGTTVQGVINSVSGDLATLEANAGTAIADAHTHSNKALLDTYTQTESDLASAVADDHTHSNKALLDTYTQTESDLASAVADDHTHSNKALLDTYTQSETDIADAVTQKHSHTNKSLLDSYTQTETDLADAVSKKHEHSNKAVLDKFSEVSGDPYYDGNPIGGGGSGDAYKSIKVGTTTLTASGADTIEFVADDNIILTPDSTTTPKQIKIKSTGGGTGSASWGGISGTLSNQTDLQTALNAKADTSSLKDLAYIDKDGVSSTKYLRGDGTWQTMPTIPTKVSDLTNDSGYQTASDVATAISGKADTSSLGDLAYIDIDGQSSTKVLQGDGTWVTPSSGGHNMLDNSTIISGIKGAITEGTTNDDVVSGYGVGVWANTDTNIILSEVNQGDTEMGEWEDDSTWETGSRVGWLYHKALFKVLDTNSGVHIEPSFELQEHQNSGIGYVAYRIEDEIYQSTTPTSNPKAEGLYELSGTTYVLTNDETIVSGKTYYVGLGAGAIKFNAPIPTTGVQVGFVLTKLRTNVFRGITRSTS